MTMYEAKEAIKEAYGNSEYTDEIIKALEQEPKTGHWIGDAMSLMTGINYEMCSCCRRLQERRTNFCPNCGADMRGSENEN